MCAKLAKTSRGAKLSKKPQLKKSKTMKVVSNKISLKKSYSGDSSNTYLTNFDNFANNKNAQLCCGRKRWKTLNEREVLECYFELDQEWSRKTILYVKDLVQLSEKQIYKWGYEKRRRLNLHDKEDKSFNLKYVTKLEDLNTTSRCEDFNMIVAGLFPEEENEEETLTDEQREMYDKVRDQLLERSEEYEQQTDLDKLLNDRIPIRNLALEAKASRELFSNTDTSDCKSDLSHSNKKDGCEKVKLVQNSLFGNQEVVDEKCSSRDSSSTVFGSPCADIINKSADSTSNQFGPGLEVQLLDLHNLTNGKASTSSERFSDIEQDICFGTGAESFLEPFEVVDEHEALQFSKLASMPNCLILNLPNPLRHAEEE